MTTNNQSRNAGRRIITQAEAEAINAKAPREAPRSKRRQRPRMTRREALTYAMAASGALILATGTAALVLPEPSNDPFLSALTPKVIQESVPGGFAYPRFKAGEFGGMFTLARKATDFTTADPPDLNPTGKFYIVKTDQPVEVQGHEVLAQHGIMAIYQVCTHLGCLIPFQPAENRYICPCHGSTFERNSRYVRGPAPRNLDRFEIEVGADGTIVVDTGKRRLGLPH